MLATLEWHRAGLRVANYAAQQVMILWREMDRQGKAGGRGGAGGVNGVMLICL